MIHRTRLITTDIGSSEAGFREWLETAPGQLLLDQESQILADLSADLFGYHLLQVGPLGEDCSYLADCPVQHKTLITASKQTRVDGMAYLRADSQQLPVSSDSVDAVLLPHTLDFARNPHQVLREAERVLIPEGRLLVLGFNPFSLWGLWRLLLRPRKRIPWTGNFVPCRHLQDWLSLLGFDVEHTAVRLYRPPFGRASVLERLRFLERRGQQFWPVLGGIYLVKAVKRTSCITPIEPRWRVQPIGAGVIEPSARAANLG